MKEPIRTTSTDESGLLQKAQTHFAAGHYQEASEQFQGLLNQFDRPEYRCQLAQCYLQWALSVATKGQLLEAAALWENYARWADAPLSAQDSYIFWLLAAKDNPKAYASLEGLTNRQLDQDYPELAVLLGFLLVSGQTASSG